MQPQLLTLGEGGHRIVVIDDFSGRREAIIAIAAALAPFPPECATAYPGLRRIITEADKDAFAYATEILQTAAPFLGGTWDIDRFDWLEASFSMVTTPPDALRPFQSAPHYDSPDPGYFALLHYLSDTPGSGTAFYRHRATGTERVDEASALRLVNAATRETQADPQSGYVSGSNAYFEEIAFVEAVPDRLIIYQGALLHSGRIPADMAFSDNPRKGRLTGNIFVKGY